MDVWLDVARGPLFALTFLIMILGLARHVVVQLHMLLGKGPRLRQVRWRTVVGDSLGWLVPLRHFSRGTVLLSAISVLFHVGVVLVPPLLAEHMVLWERLTGLGLPALAAPAAEFLTILVLACGLGLLAYRLLVPRARALSSVGDYVLLVVVLLPFVTGYLAAHPAVNPLPWTTAMLLHVLSADALFVAVPFTKLAHVVLLPFDRLSAVHWQLQPGSGELVANALYGEEVKV
jgi:nitrate reductase gamma subunit